MQHVFAYKCNIYNPCIHPIMDSINLSSYKFIQAVDESIITCLNLFKYNQISSSMLLKTIHTLLWNLQHLNKLSYHISYNDMSGSLEITIVYL
jgi:hypothetical protein